MKHPYILAIDQGTTSTTCLVVDVTPGAGQTIVARGRAELPQHFTRPGWVEHDLEEIWQSVLQAVHSAIKDLPQGALYAVALTNQRETCALWHRTRGPLHNAIVWQDRRTQSACAAHQQAGHGPLLQRKTGLVFDPYFSASKLSWLLANVPAARSKAAQGDICCGTIDTWLLYKLTGGKVHATDTTNAARTALFDIHEERWDDELLGLWDPMAPAMLPEVHPSDTLFGHTLGVPGLPDGLPIAGIAGDQHASLVGQACIRPGTVKCTLGTGAFVMMNTGDVAPESRHQLLTTIGWRVRSGRAYALEGSLFVAGAMVQWLRDGLGIIQESEEVEVLARQVPDTGGVVVVPALAGLGAPHWRPDARGLISGLTRGTHAAHIARATLEGIALQTADLMSAIAQDAGMPVHRLRVDGGAAADDLLLQMHADFLKLPVDRPASIETTALGAAYLGALGCGLFKNFDEIEASWRCAQSFEPTLDDSARQATWQRWHQALSRT
jgi:glycerol kinase